MAGEQTEETTHDFLRKMDAGDFDGTLAQELKNLSKEQLQALAEILVERDAKREG